MNQEPRCCPQCQSGDLQQDHLSQKGSAWPVLFGGTLFEKKELLAYACKKCGFVFLSWVPRLTNLNLRIETVPGKPD